MRRGVVVTLSLVLLGALGSALASARAASDDDVVFTRTDGLSSAGTVLARWLDRARWHGIELELDARVSAWIADHDHDDGKQRDVERALREGLARLVAELPPRPRTAPVLADPKYGYYLSPDVTWLSAPTPTATSEALDEALAAARAGRLDEHLSALQPKHPQYARLLAASERYADLCARGGWPTLTMPANEKKAAAPAVAQELQARLAIEGFYRPPGGVASGVWDAATRDALVAFRDARQIKDRGVADRLLYEALDVPCAARLATLSLNARRWRVSAWHDDPTWVEVNLAGQELRYFRDHAMVRHERTVVGSDAWFFHKGVGRRLYTNASPILSDHISRIVINPEWAVPARIARNEIDPKVLADPSYLESNGFRKVTSATGGYTYIQGAGAGNALGQIKILFPNSESVYLHDTAKKAAFRLAVRAASHGCVRVQHALDLGIELLAGDAATAGRVFDEDQVRMQVYRGSRNYDLEREVPVFWEYYTASVDEAGVVRFHPDIYNYDADARAAPLRAAAP